MEDLKLTYKGKEVNCTTSAQLNSVDYIYHKLMVDILTEGVWKDNRTGIRTISMFGPVLIHKK